MIFSVSGYITFKALYNFDFQFWKILITPAILGTFYVSLLVLLLTFPLSFLTSINIFFYSNEDGIYRSSTILSLRVLSKTPVVIFVLVAVFIFKDISQYTLLSTVLTFFIILYPSTSLKLFNLYKNISNDELNTAYALGASTEFMIFKVILPKYIYQIGGVAVETFAKTIGMVIPVVVFLKLNNPADGGDEVILSTLASQIFFFMEDSDFRYSAFMVTVILMLSILLLNFWAQNWKKRI